MSIEVLIFWILVIDSVGANLMAWSDGKKWYQKHFRLMSRYFPASRGWTTYYFLLVVWIGFLLIQNGDLSF